jgi:glycosyltransferase involved in cell wall biosynthesis
VFPVFGTGGPEVRTAKLINALGESYRHTIISLNGELSCRSRLAYPVQFVPAPQRHGRLSYPLALGRLLRELRPDLLLTYGWGGTDAVLGAWLTGMRRVIHAEDGFLPEERQGQRLSRLLTRCVLLRLPARVVCPSHTLVRVAERRWFLPRRSVQYLPNGVNTAHFAPPSAEAASAARKRFGIESGELVIGSVGMLRGEKNYARLLRAFAEVNATRRARMLLVGDGPLRDELQGEAQNLGIANRVVFAGVLDDPLAAYQAMDVFALSSDTEQMPIALLEAMAVGLPVVSTDVGDVKAMVHATNRLFVTPLGQESRFAAALAGLLDDGSLRLELGKSNRHVCSEQFDVDVMTRAYDRLYREILRRN